MEVLPLEQYQKEKLFRRTHHLTVSTVIIVLVFVAGVVWAGMRVPTPTISPEFTGDLAADAGVPIDFNWPVSRNVEVTVTPSVYGQLTYAYPVISGRLSRRVVFQPELTWAPDTTYVITVANVRSAFSLFRKPQTYTLTVSTAPLPRVTSVTPANDGPIRPDVGWVVSFDRPLNRYAEFTYVFSPAIEFTQAVSADKRSITLTPAQPLSQGAAYALAITSEKVRYVSGSTTVAYQDEPVPAWDGTWTVREAPGIAGFSPEGLAVTLDTPISVSFDEEIDLASIEQYASFAPELPGEWSAQDATTAVYTPDELSQETTYLVTIAAGTKTKTGGYLPEASVHQFTTIGPVAVSSSSPGNGNAGVSVGHDISITFDQAVDQASAEGKFGIQPSVIGAFSWSGNTLTFNPEAQLEFNTVYTVTLASGIQSVSGFDSDSEQRISFTTELSVVKLAVPFHRQEHNLSCEAAALYMALRYRGVSVTETALINAMGFDPTQKANGVWGNPNVAFVGDIDGHQPTTGYGVYWDPVAKAAQAYRPARAFTGWTIQQLTAEIKKGNPVVIWGTAGTGKRIDWKTPQGGNVVAVSGEHVRVAIGFIGPADNPTKIITMDPLAGEKYFTRSSFDWNWGLLGNSGVVIE